MKRRYIRNKDTGVVFPATKLLEEQIEMGHLPNLEIVEMEVEDKKSKGIIKLDDTTGTVRQGKT